MHKQLIKELKNYDGKFYKADTNELVGDTLKIYCFKSDDNNIYYDEPVIDYPENYVLVKNNGEKISVRDIFESEGTYNNFYAIISKHKKITSIENFNIEECNNFYSIKIKKEIKEILETIGLDKLIVDEKALNFNLIEVKAKPTGFELLFFVYSNDNFVNDILNEYRLKIVKQQIDYFCELCCDNGIHALYDHAIRQFTFSLADKINLYSSSKEIYKKLEENSKFVKRYSKLLYERIEMLLKMNVRDKNFLYFGYTDEWIVEELKKYEIL